MNEQEEVWILKRPSVAEMKRQYEEMVERINGGDPKPFKTNNIEKILYMRRKRLQESVPTQDTRPKASHRFSITVPLQLPEISDEEESEEEEEPTPASNSSIKKIESIEEWWSEFHSHAITKYEVNVSSLSIGDMALMELSNKLMELIDKMPASPIVQSIDLSWNDIYEEGMIGFCGVVDRLSGLSQIRLDGNPIGTNGLEAFLRAMTNAQPEPPKKRSTSFRRPGSNSRPGTPQGGGGGTLRRSDCNTPLPGVYLSLRETNIGDESTTCIASFLKPNPTMKQLNLIALDLTNTYIFDGITAITLALQKNNTVTTLVLNSNMIGDQGAFAIGEMLLVNRTLNRLEMRNCDIGATGTTHLCDGLRGHLGIFKMDLSDVFTIDVCLNPWEFTGELELLQTAVAKPDMVIKWRDADAEWEGSDEELETIIRTFGEDKVMTRLLAGQGFEPLAGPARLIASPLIANYAPVHIGTTLDTLSPNYSSSRSTSTTNPLYLLTIILQLLELHHRTHFKSWISILPTILSSLTGWVDPTIPTSTNPYRRQIEVLTLDLLLVLAKTNQLIMDDLIVRSGILSKCLDNFFAFQNHNIYHLRLITLVEVFLSATTSEALRACIINMITNGVYERLATLVRKQCALPIPARSGLLGVSINFIETIEPSLDVRLSKSLRVCIAKFKEEQKGSLGGPRPERTSVKLVLNASKID